MWWWRRYRFFLLHFDIVIVVAVLESIVNLRCLKCGVCSCVHFFLLTFVSSHNPVGYLFVWIQMEFLDVVILTAPSHARKTHFNFFIFCIYRNTHHPIQICNAYHKLNHFLLYATGDYAVVQEPSFFLFRSISQINANSQLKRINWWIIKKNKNESKIEQKNRQVDLNWFVSRCLFCDPLLGHM